MVNNLEELMAALGMPVDDLSYLDDHIDCRLDYTYGDDCEFGDDHFVLFSSRFGPIHHHLPFPMTLADFDKSMTELDERMFFMHLAESVAQDPDDYVSELETTKRLAEFFGVDPVTFVTVVGGGWYPVGGQHLVGVGQTAFAWFGSGVPVQVIIGLGEAAVSVLYTEGDEDEFEVGDHVRGTPLEDVPLRMVPETLPMLGEAVKQALAQSRKAWGDCEGCRGHGELVPNDYPAGRFCEACDDEYEVFTTRFVPGVDGTSGGKPLPPKPKPR